MVINLKLHFAMWPVVFSLTWYYADYWLQNCFLSLVFIIYIFFCVTFSWIYARKWPDIIQGPQLSAVSNVLSFLAWVIVLSPIVVLITWGAIVIGLLRRNIIGLAVIMAGTALLLAFYSIMLWWRTQWQSSSMHISPTFEYCNWFIQLFLDFMYMALDIMWIIKTIRIVLVLQLQLGILIYKLGFLVWITLVSSGYPLWSISEFLISVFHSISFM